MKCFLQHIRQAKDTQVMFFHENERYGDGGREGKKNKERASLIHHLYIKVWVRGAHIWHKLVVRKLLIGND